MNLTEFIIIRGIWNFMMAGLVGYYFVALYNVWNDMSGSGAASGGDNKQTVNPA